MPFSKVTLPNANLESIFSCAKQPIFITGPNLKVIYANNHTTKLVGKSKLKTLCCYEIFHSNKKQPSNCPWKKPACGLRTEKQCECFKGKNENTCQIDAVPIFDSDSQMIAALHMLEVTTELVNLSEELLQSNKELQLLNEMGAILSQSLNLNEVLNESLKRLLEWSDFKGASVFLVTDGFVEMEAYQGLSNRFVRGMKRMPLGQGLSGLAAARKKRIISEDGQLDMRTRTTLLSKEGLHATVAVPIVSKDKCVGVLTLGTGVIRKFTSREVKLLESIADQMGVVIENAKLHQQTIYLSRTDNLTGLFNARYFEEILQNQLSLSKRKNLSLVLMMLDIDNLKEVNDLYGHDSGDLLLRKFAKILQENLRQSDFYARYGGDEFVILLPDSNQKMARTVANKLIKAVASARIFGFDRRPLMTTSLGIAVFPEAASTMISLIKAADIAMYRAKQDGKNRFYFYEPHLLPDIHFDSKRLERIAHNADLNAIQTLVTAIDLKDSYTGSHSSEVSRLAVFLAQRMGLKKQELDDIRIASLLHDVGKIGVPDNILLKSSKLTSKEFEQIRKHPELSVSILKYSKEFKRQLPIVLHHHERWDGKGYPYGLQGEGIPLLARIIAIVDAYEAMTSNRPYRKAMTREKAISQLWKFAERQFDPELVKVFTALIKDIEKREKSGSLLIKTSS